MEIFLDHYARALLTCANSVMRRTKLDWTVIVLLVHVLGMSGCGTGEQSETLFEPSHTPSLAHVGTAVEITMDESIGCFYGHSLEGDVLIGLTRQAGQAQPAVVSLTTGEAHHQFFQTWCAG